MKYLFLVVFLAGCSLTPSKTANQKLFSVVSNYKTVQHTALNYKKDCNTKPINHYCNDIVKKVAKMDEKANFLIQSIDGNTISKSYSNSVFNAISEISKKIILTVEESDE